MDFESVRAELGVLHDAPVERLIAHWTAGGPTPNDRERDHYHFLIEQNGAVVRGHYELGLPPPPDHSYAWPQHTRELNTGSVGVALCGMLGATPKDHGAVPINPLQMEKLILVLAALAGRYDLSVAETTVTVHADVGRVYGIAQRGKWDISFWPGRPKVKGAAQVAHEIRRALRAALF